MSAHLLDRLAAAKLWLITEPDSPGLDDARSRGVERVSLETGSMAFFEPARRFYARAGFVACRPFGSYVEDPNSTFMRLDLTT